MIDQDMNILNATYITTAIDVTGSTSAMFDSDTSDTVNENETDGYSVGGTAVGAKRRRDSKESDSIDLSSSDSDATIDVNDSDSDHTHAGFRSIHGRSSNASWVYGKSRSGSRTLAVSELGVHNNAMAILTDEAPTARLGGRGRGGVSKRAGRGRKGGIYISTETSVS